MMHRTIDELEALVEGAKKCLIGRFDLDTAAPEVTRQLIEIMKERDALKLALIKYETDILLGKET